MIPQKGASEFEFRRMFQTLLAVTMFCIMTTAVQAVYLPADTFQNPMASYVINSSNRFGEYLPDFSGYHAGEDLQAVALTTEVRAIANGRVMYVQKNSKAKGYGQAVVMEHTLPDNTKIISIYGHLSRQKYLIAADPNKDVTKGTLLGYIGETWENGGWEPHLHIGIKKGQWDGANYEGRTDLAGLAKFNKPSDYLNLIRTVNTNNVYCLANIESKALISYNSFISCGWRWDDVRPVSSTEMSRHGSFSPQAVCFAPGTFIKRANNPDISLVKSYSDGSGTIKNVFRKRFTKWEAFIRAGGKTDLSNVKIVSDAEYNLHAQGKDLTYNGNY
jgi:hypothetical protein